MLFIGIDIGTTTVCSLAYDREYRKTNVIILRNIAGLHSDNEWEKMQDLEK